MKKIVAEDIVGFLPVEEIEKYIKEKYSPKKYMVHTSRGEFDDIYIEVESKEKGIKKTVIYRFKDEAIFNICKEILELKEIESERYYCQLELDEDKVFYLFKGVKFKWINSEEE